MVSPLDLPPARNGCTCECHRTPGIIHIAACCPHDAKSVSSLDAKEQTEIVEDLRTMSDPYGAVAMGSTPTAADLMRTAADLITAQAERIAELERTVLRVWAALGCTTYEDAGGKEISELVADAQAEVRTLREALEKPPVYKPRQKKADTRFAVTWLLHRARTMNDPHARAVLNSAAFHLGIEGEPVAAALRAKEP